MAVCTVACPVKRMTGVSGRAPKNALAKLEKVPRRPGIAKSVRHEVEVIVRETRSTASFDEVTATIA